MLHQASTMSPMLHGCGSRAARRPSSTHGARAAVRVSGQVARLPRSIRASTTSPMLHGTVTREGSLVAPGAPDVYSFSALPPLPTHRDPRAGHARAGRDRLRAGRSRRSRSRAVDTLRSAVARATPRGCSNAASRSAPDRNRQRPGVTGCVRPLDRRGDAAAIRGTWLPPVRRQRDSRACERC